jgi:AcrR family transcriptional regulator
MNRTKRITKEKLIIDAAEKTFAAVGFLNATMGEIAEKIEMSKGSVYFYFSSKENLYMAVTYRAWQALLDRHYYCLQFVKSKNGFETTAELFKVAMEFAEEHPYYFELIMNFIALMRSANQQKLAKDKVREALEDSIYYRKILDINNLPLSIVTKEIERGQKDGSIKNQRNPVLLYLSAWALLTGYMTLNASNSKSGKSTIFRVDIEYWRHYTMKMVQDILNDEIECDYQKQETLEVIPEF